MFNKISEKYISRKTLTNVFPIQNEIHFIHICIQYFCFQVLMVCNIFIALTSICWAYTGILRNPSRTSCSLRPPCPPPPHWCTLTADSSKETCWAWNNILWLKWKHDFEVFGYPNIRKSCDFQSREVNDESHLILALTLGRAPGSPPPCRVPGAGSRVSRRWRAGGSPCHPVQSWTENSPRT